MKYRMAKARGIESFVSVFLILVLVVIGAAVFAKQFHYDRSVFEIPSPEQSVEINMAELAVSGFKTIGQTESYDKNNLYEKINGKAELYIPAGFSKLYYQRFGDEQNKNLWIELYIYDMADIHNAYSVFSLQRRLNAKMISLLPDFHYLTDNGVYLAYGNYYIEAVGSAENEKISKVLISMASSLAYKLFSAEQSKLIQEKFILLNTEDIRSDVKLYAKGAFGFDGFENVFSCQYKIGSENVTVFLTQQKDARKAKKIADAYCKFMISNDAKEISIEELNAKAFDYYGTTEIVFASGDFVGGVHESKSRPAAIKAAKKLIKNLSKK